MSARVDVLAVLDRVAGSAHTLREFARDTGPFRVNKPGAADLAEACTAALAVIEARAAVAELVAAVESDATGRAVAAGLGASEWRAFLPERTRAALARIGGAK